MVPPSPAAHTPPEGAHHAAYSSRDVWLFTECQAAPSFIHPDVWRVFPPLPTIQTPAFWLPQIALNVIGSTSDGVLGLVGETFQFGSPFCQPSEWKTEGVIIVLGGFGEPGPPGPGSIGPGSIGPGTLNSKDMPTAQTSVALEPHIAAIGGGQRASVRPDSPVERDHAPPLASRCQTEALVLNVQTSPPPLPHTPNSDWPVSIVSASRPLPSQWRTTAGLPAIHTSSGPDPQIPLMATGDRGSATRHQFPAAQPVSGIEAVASDVEPGAGGSSSWGAALSAQLATR